MRIKKSSCIFVLALVILTLSFSCSTKPTNKNDKIIVGYLPIIANLPTIVAKERGYLEGLPIEIRVFASSNDLISAVLDNKINAATTVSVASVAQAIKSKNLQKKPSNIRFISYSKTSMKDPFDSMFVKSTSNINSIEDLVNKRIGVFPGTTAKNICIYFLSAIKKINTTGITWVGLPPNLQIEALRSGDIDALFTYEPTVTAAKNNQFKLLYGSIIASVLDDAPYGGSIINTDFEKSNQEITKRFIKAFDKAILYTREYPEESKLIMSRVLSISDVIANKCSIEYRFTSDEIFKRENLDRFQKFLDILVDIKEIPTKMSYTELIH